MTRPHTTHHESCGCCEAERDALKAQVEEAESHAEWRGSILRDLLRQTSNGDVRGECGAADCLHIWCRVLRDARFALAASPAQSLAAHDAEVRAKALREAAALAKDYELRMAHTAVQRASEGKPSTVAESKADAGRSLSSAILALAERAPEVTR